MPKFAANLSFLFTEVDFPARFAAARRAGFSAVEFHFPYGYAPTQLAAVVARAGVKVVLFNLPPGDSTKGERGIACHPDRIGEFQDGVGRAIEYAAALGCRHVNALAGIAPAAVSGAKLRDTFVANCRFAARELGKAGVTLLAEPINTRSVPGVWLNRTAQLLDIIREVEAPNFLVQYDVFHMQIMEGDLALTLQTHLADIGHVQIADVPGRNEPGTGEVNFPFLFGHLDRIGYDGWIGCEYTPANGTVEGLGWASRYLKGAPEGST